MSYFSAEAQRRGGYKFDIPFSRQQLADYLGVERSGLSVELGKMRDEGLLDFHKSHFLLKVPETDEPCNECLTECAREGTVKPVKFEEKTRK